VARSSIQRSSELANLGQDEDFKGLFCHGIPAKESKALSWAEEHLPGVEDTKVPDILRRLKIQLGLEVFYQRMSKIYLERGETVKEYPKNWKALLIRRVVTVTWLMENLTSQGSDQKEPKFELRRRWRRGFSLKLVADRISLGKLIQTCASPTQIVDDGESMLDEKLKGEENIEECIKMMMVLKGSRPFPKSSAQRWVECIQAPFKSGEIEKGWEKLPKKEKEESEA
jgi:hypothetical protein